MQLFRHPTPLAAIAILLFISSLLVGCRDSVVPGIRNGEADEDAYQNRKILTPKPKPEPDDVDTSAEVALIEKAFEQSRSSRTTYGSAEFGAVQLATRAIDQNLDLAPTLVIWLFDKTMTSQKMVIQSASAAKSYYASPSTREKLSDVNSPLVSVLATFGDDVEYITPEPTADGDKIAEAFDTLVNTAPAEGGPTRPITAAASVAQKFLNIRTDEGRQVLIVMVTAQAGADDDKAEEIASLLGRSAIPLYVIGTAAPWGQSGPPVDVTARATKKDDAFVVRYGPESRYSERVVVHTSGTTGSRRNEQLAIESGFGPFALEWVARGSGGMFLASRVAPGSFSNLRYGSTYTVWPTGSEWRFDPKVVSRYAPDYLSEQAYRAKLAKNPAASALHEVAKLGDLVIDDYPDLTFARKSEAQMARQLSGAQQYAAKNVPAVDRRYDMLIAGEASRDQLTEPRWQAEFDIAIGQVLAAKVRLDGYNAMIAALKRGKTPTNPEAGFWILEPADTIETGSQLQKMGEKATMYLQRVIAEHPGTPWAQLADEELKRPLGWIWKEG